MKSAFLAAATLLLVGHGSVVPASAAEAGKSALGRYPERVYVPNAAANTLHVIDPKTFKITATYGVGRTPTMSRRLGTLPSCTSRTRGETRSP